MVPLMLHLVLASSVALVAARDVRVSTTPELRAALREAQPGALILLASGTYEGFSFEGLRGSEREPVVVRSAERAAPARFTGGVHFSRIAHVELADFEIVGAPANGLNIDDGGALDAPAHHVVLRGLAVRDCGRTGNEDGIKLSGVSDFRVDGCGVERWGRGGSAIDMVGCQRGEIVASWFTDREQDSAASGVQMKGGSREIAVLDCRFTHAGQRAVNIGGSTGLAFFRPRPQGFEARDIRVEGCTFSGSLAPIAFVGVDGASVRFNTFHRPRKWLARILQETREPGFVPARAGSVTDNLVVYRASELALAVNVGDGTQPESFEFARNYWYCEDQPGRARPTLPVEERDGAGGRDPLLRDVAAGDLRLAENSPARACGADAWPGRAAHPARR